jgi:hypothetical protein
MFNNEKCATEGHNFHSQSYVYARDEKGIAFKGGNDWHVARKYTQLFCSRCGITFEVEVCPHLERRGSVGLDPKKPIAPRPKAVVA